jgi:quercetin dioxygenase-like cupin family protein
MAEPLFERSGGGDALGNPLGGTVVFKARGEQTDGALTAFEVAVPPGEGPPLHVHANEEETLYVLEGDVRFKLGDDLRVASAGAFAFVPRGKPHTFQNVGSSPARLLIHFAPAGMERFFEGFAEVENPGPDAFKTIGAPAGMEIVGPPLAQSDPL